MSSFYCPIDLCNCNGFVTVYPICSYVGSYGWFAARMWQISSVFLPQFVIYAWINNLNTITLKRSQVVSLIWFRLSLYNLDMKWWQTVGRKQREGGFSPEIGFRLTTGTLIRADSVTCVWGCDYGSAEISFYALVRSFLCMKASQSTIQQKMKNWWGQDA